MMKNSFVAEVILEKWSFSFAKVKQLLNQQYTKIQLSPQKHYWGNLKSDYKYRSGS